MRVSLIKDDLIRDLILPNEIEGSFWLTDIDLSDNEVNLINIEESEQGWKMLSNDDVFCISNNKKVDYLILENYKFYTIKSKNSNSIMVIYCSPIFDPTFKSYEISSIVDGITIGSSSNCDIFYKTSLLAPIQARISLLSLEQKAKSNNNKLIIKELDPVYNVRSTKWGVYINGKRLRLKSIISNNDVIFIMGLKITVSFINGKYILLVNNPNSLVVINKYKEIVKSINNNNYSIEYDTNDENISIDSPRYYLKKPRFVKKLVDFNLSIDDPPGKEKEQNTPVILTIGPMLTMSMTSLVMGYSAINNVYTNNASWNSAMPSLIICIVMFASVFIWPFITKAYDKRKHRDDENERQVKYKAYLKEKSEEVQQEIVNQERLLLERYPSTDECERIIKHKSDRFWERRIIDDDFLRLNLGYGNKDMNINIKYSEKHFSMIEDNLKSLVNKFGNMPKILKSVPIDISLIENKLLGVIGEYVNTKNFTKQLLLQLLALHSYDDVKIVILSDKYKSHNWEEFKIVPHIFSDEKDIRYFGTEENEYKEIFYHLEQIYNNRKEAFQEEFDPKLLDKHYIIITDSYKNIRSFEMIKKLLGEKIYYGISLIILDDNFKTLPNSISTFIDINSYQGELFNSNKNIKKLSFFINNKLYNYTECFKILANTYVEIDKDKTGKLPDKLSFLEMYKVNKIDELNIVNRWKNNNPVLSLNAPVGVDIDGDNIGLDLHEKFHGPHGLIAGMTGSGKSEFIITYILSLAINFHPYEVQFILIDYKGGGLAGAFENEVTGIKLPHLVGAITNLDTNEIQRSFASIESELKRRQALFNKARELSGESTIDIYKYQKMYREGKLEEPVSHLFIICDEFAELKTQEPEFMEQLISTARIGRSLGVHLILATQKPSGVVDPQIWSNTRFRVCLRVQEKSDSSEVIKRPDAAYLKHTGRFYFQVGFNEIFTLGQASWAGAPYYPTKKAKATINSSIEFINNLGYVIKSVDTNKKETFKSDGEELYNIVKQLSDISKKSEINAKPLWLDKIPSEIFVNELIKKYNYQKEEYNINLVIGEYDNPDNQSQHLLTLSLTKEGNAVIYGSAGSGKENFLNTLIYSSMLYYGPDELNYYIMDFGSESLRMFKDSSIVGDVLLSNEEEKQENLFKMIENELERRKKLFSEYGGDYTSYIKSSKEKVPAIVVIINNFEAYQDLEEDFDDDLVIMTRDCTKYGIYFILTVTSSNGIRFKLKQNFNQEFVLQQNNEDDYSAIIGSSTKIMPSKTFGRGIVKLEDVYEFQTAFVCDKDNIRSFIKEESERISKNYETKAKKVKVLPEVVGFNDIKEDLDNTNELQIGLSKDELEVESIDYKKSFISIITSEDISLAYTFIEPMIKQLIYKKQNVVFVNAEDYGLSDELLPKINYINEDFDKLFEVGEALIQKEIPSVIIFNGIVSFLSYINSDNNRAFAQFLEKLNHSKKVNIIILESIDRIRKIEVESWFKNYVNLSNGIWIGNGINDQFSIKVTKRNKYLKEEIEDNYAFVVKRGRPTLVKLLEDFDQEE